MNRFSKSVTSIKKSKIKNNISVVILSAGIGARIKSSEPRSLLKIGNQYLIDHQISVINNTFNNPEIIGVFGVGIDKIIKRVKDKIRIIENQLYESTNNSESLRLAINNTMMESVLFFHGDLYFNKNTFDNVNFNKSFILVDNEKHFGEFEVGVTTHDKRVTIFSYGLDTKWCQIAFITGKELKIIKNIYSKYKPEDKKMLSFEVLNKVIESGGSFEFYQHGNTPIIEIDCIKDLYNENFNKQ